jgi:hypothetical protein
LKEFRDLLDSVGTHKFEAIILILNDDEAARRIRSADQVRAAPALSLIVVACSNTHSILRCTALAEQDVC